MNEKYQDMINQIKVSKELQEKVRNIPYRKQKKIRYNIRVTATVAAAAVICVLATNIAAYAATGQMWIQQLFSDSSVVQIDGQSKEMKNEVTVSLRDGKKRLLENREEIKRTGTEVEFYSQVNITEYDYWNYMNENAIQESPILDKLEQYIPNGYIFDENQSFDLYTYILNTNHYYINHDEDELDRTKPLKNYEKTGAVLGENFCCEDFDKELKDQSLSEEERKSLKELKAESAHTEKMCIWSNQYGEIKYFERVNPWTHKTSYTDVKDILETKLNGNRAYIMYHNNGKISARIYTDGKVISLSIDVGSVEKAEELLYAVTG